MPFQFRWLCELLEDLHKSSYKRTLTAARNQNYEQQVIYRWYQRYSDRVERTGSSAVAFLSCLLPERRPDRVYNLQAKRLSRIFGRALALGSSRALELNQWQEQEGADFATCVERVLQACENDAPMPGKEVSLEEIDEALDLIAARAPSSSAAIRAKATSATPVDLLGPILFRLKSNEAKWLARMLLKSYAPVQIPEFEALKGFHFMLPDLLAIQNSFHAAIVVLSKEEICQLPARPDKNYEFALRPLLGGHVQPRLGVMIKRQPYYKARSIKNCCTLAQGRQMSIERKYDGEYCQIHIDISKGHDCVQIFSKSGRDSTEDRDRLHGVIKDALRIDRNGCKIRSRCIVEGELLVWSSANKQIQPFHKIRKYVKHGGRKIGTAQDSPPRRDENLMVAFYDILMLDDLTLLTKPHKTRRQYLKAVLHTMEGGAILCERKVMDFRSTGSPKKLREIFAKAITQRWEGLVLKGLNEPYFSWGNQNHSIKLKKDYIAGLGDTADLCIVGGRRDPQVELQIGLGPLSWTSFYVGAVCNMEAMRRFDEKPQIKIIDILTQYSMPDRELLDLNRLGRLFQVDYDSQIAEFDVEMGRHDMAKPTVLFKRPFIVEIMGAGFEKLSNSSFYTLRFPRKVDGSVKMHTDRTLSDTVSFSELQKMAEQSMSAPEDSESQEDARWIEGLIRADGKGGQAQSVSQESGSAVTLTSASTISISPVRPRHKASSSVFIRPDTEEPETQQVIESVSSFQAASDSHNSPQKRPCASVVMYSQNNGQKRKTRDPQSLRAEDNESARNKRLCLREIQLDDQHNAVIDLASSIDPAEPLVDCSKTQTQPEPKSPRQKETRPQSATVSDLPADFHTPDRRTTSFVIGITFNKQNPRARPLSPCPLPLPQLSNSLPTILPTPPVSSPASAKDAAKTIMSTGQETSPPAQTATENSTNHNESEHQGQPTHLSSTISEAMSGFVLAYMPPQRRDDRPPPNPIPIFFLNLPANLTILSDFRASFTFSPVHFLDQIYAIENSSPLHPILLIKLSTPEETATDFVRLARLLQSRIHSSSNQSIPDNLLLYNRNEILVFDHTILHHPTTRDRGLITPKILSSLDYRNGNGNDAELFCGIVKFYERKVSDRPGPDGVVDDLKIGVKVEYVFDWVKRYQEIEIGR